MRSVFNAFLAVFRLSIRVDVGDKRIRSNSHELKNQSYGDTEFEVMNPYGYVFGELAPEV